MRETRTLRLSVFDKDLNPLGWISNPVSCSFTQRWWGQSSGEVTVDISDPIVAKLEQPGVRVKVDYLPEDTSDEFRTLQGVPYFPFLKPFMNGPITAKSNPFLPTGTATYQISDDWRWLGKGLAWVIPNGYPPPYVQNGEISPTNIARWGQTWANPSEGVQSGTVYGLVGRMPWPSSPSTYPAETAVRWLLSKNLIKRVNERVGWTKIDDLASTGLGPNVRSILPQVRFGTLEDYVVPLLQAGGLGLQFQQLPGFIRPVIWEPKTWSQVFTPETGVVVDGRVGVQYPTVTDVVVGGPGEEAARAFRNYSDADVSDEFGDVLEVFRDATGAPVYWPEGFADINKVPMYYHLLTSEIGADRRAAFERFLTDAGSDTLAEGAQKTSLSVDIAESAGFYFGGSGDDGFHIGDRITVAPSKATGLVAQYTDRITSVTVSRSREAGVTVSAGMGDRTDDSTAQMASLVRRIVDSNRRARVNQ